MSLTLHSTRQVFGIVGMDAINRMCGDRPDLTRSKRVVDLFAVIGP